MDIVICMDCTTPDNASSTFCGHSCKKGTKNPLKPTDYYWLNGFLERPASSEMTEEIVNNISDRYVELYEKVTGNKFTPPTDQNIAERVETNINKYLNR